METLFMFNVRNTGDGFKVVIRAVDQTDALEEVKQVVKDIERGARVIDNGFSLNELPETVKPIDGNENAWIIEPVTRVNAEKFTWQDGDLKFEADDGKPLTDTVDFGDDD